MDLGQWKGISEARAQVKLEKEGFNELPSAKKKTGFTLAIDVLREPMFLLLVACGIIYLFLGDLQEALILLSFVFVIMGITFYQERKTERALEALRDLSSPQALVIRDGVQKRISGREVVSGDFLILSEGDRIPADGVLLSSLNFSVDESLLTGESVPVRKSSSVVEQATMGAPGGNDSPYVYSGTLVVQGQGIARVVSTGLRTEIGKIGKALQTVETEGTTIQKDTSRLVRNLAIFGFLLCLVVVIAYGLTRGNWLNGILAGLTLAMAVLPEELPVILTIFLALGAWRISRKKVLTRRVPAVEMLGSATVLCVDKTGTLTLNRMAVRHLFVGEEELEISPTEATFLPEKFHQLVEFSILSSQREPFDPMEKAILQMGNLIDEEHLHQKWELVREYPLNKNMMALSHVWRSTGKFPYVVAVKGAPEAVADLCHIGNEEKEHLSQQVKKMASKGLRLLGVARADYIGDELPDNPHDFSFTFLGLIGLEDPIRPSAATAIQECYNAGIRVVMITGDYPVTAQSIAKQIGLTPHDLVITGSQLSELDDEELKSKIKRINIFARVAPEQKLRIVNALKGIKEIVAMTGDGVNDAPALKSAHIGISMGKRGTDVAREASSLVLLEDDFDSIVHTVRLGRRIFDNLKKAIAFTFAVHVPIIGLSLFPVLLQWPLALLPVHIVFLELLIDPSCSIVFEAEEEERNVMNRPPRDPAVSLFDRRTLLLSLMQGSIILLLVLAVFYLSLQIGQSENKARTLAFTTLIISNLGLIFTNRSWNQTILETLHKPNKALWWVTGGALFFLVIALYVPFVQSLFKFQTLTGLELLFCFIVGVFSILWFEGLKKYQRKNC